MFTRWFTAIATYFSSSALWVLFVTGFLSATLLPGGSEATLVATLSLGSYGLFSVIVVATVGNTLGGLTNYAIGTWLPNKFLGDKHANRAVTWCQHYGYWILLFSWLPVIGDPLCCAAGWLRLPFGPCVLMIAIGKALRYSFIAAVYHSIV